MHRKILQEAKHPFVLKFIEEFEYINQERNHQCIITEFASGGDLENLIKLKIKLTEDQAMTYFTMILLGLNYLHRKGIKHHDLKPHNILIVKLPDGYSILKISGFAISTLSGYQPADFDEELE